VPIFFFFAAHPGCALLAHNMRDSDFTRGSKLRHPLRQPSPTSVPKFGWRTQNTLGPSLQQQEANAYAYGSDVLGRLFLLVPLLLPRRRRRLNSHLPLSWGTALPLVPFAIPIVRIFCVIPIARIFGVHEPFPPSLLGSGRCRRRHLRPPPELRHQ
jgi:hypothetical protein